MATVQENVVRNCFFEAVTLDQPRGDDAVILRRSVRTADKQAEGFSVRHGTTYVWNPAPQGRQLTCQYRRNRCGLRTTVRKTNRDPVTPCVLRDHDKQVDFALGNKTQLCGDRENVSRFRFGSYIHSAAVIVQLRILWALLYITDLPCLPNATTEVFLDLSFN
ncbi:hypothetical protein BV898_19567 [Hypsibius exemplaris]|uniref:Uncharacterized protein n=1 Tax=Hypsibius exemplaris TaxID=2072580 RepID=A0A9X6NJG5_HYPEX|nr:hypothetical protein BV898_19567 [Hypsibius exemplaris]